jgi:hypothetical protein
VNSASHEASRAEAELSAREARAKERTSATSQKREELRRGVAQRDASVTELTSQLSAEAETHGKNLEQIRESCRLIRDRCMVPRSEAEDRRYATQVSRLTSELTRVRDERKQLQSQIDELVTKDSNERAELDQEIGTAATAVVQARQAMRSAADGNQIYRLAASWYGVNTAEVTSEQFATARWVFATFSAIAVALAGSIAALVYYARNRVPGVPSYVGLLVAKVARARRAYYSRKRRAVVREVPGPERVIYRDGKEPPIVVEKEILRFIDRIVLIPRWGVRTPTYINALIRGRDRSPVLDPSSASEIGSNVMSLAKR